MIEASHEIAIGPYRPGDESEILKSFNEVFGIGRPMETWEWLFARNPEGINCYVARTGDGRIASQYAGIPRRTRFGADHGCLLEIVDSFTHPEFRRGLKKRGLFARAWEAFVERYGHPDVHPLFYGLPNPAAYRLGKRILTYEDVCPFPIMGKPVASERPFTEELPDGARAVTIKRFGDDVTALHASVSAAHDVTNVRDARYLNWRYAARTDVDYEMVAFRDAHDALFAVAALRHRWLDAAQTAVCEVMIDRTHPLAAPVMHHLELRAQRAGSTKIRAAFRPGSPELHDLRALGYAEGNLHFKFVAHTYDEVRLPLERLRDGMHLTLGDFDLV